MHIAHNDDAVTSVDFGVLKIKERESDLSNEKANSRRMMRFLLFLL